MQPGAGSVPRIIASGVAGEQQNDTDQIGLICTFVGAGGLLALFIFAAVLGHVRSRRGRR